MKNVYVYNYNFHYHRFIAASTGEYYTISKYSYLCCRIYKNWVLERWDKTTTRLSPANLPRYPLVGFLFQERHFVVMDI